MVRPAAKREAVACLKEQFQMSERRACEVVAADRAMVRYRSVRPPETKNGTELTSHAIFAWAKDYRIDWHYIAPGRPM